MKYYFAKIVLQWCVHANRHLVSLINVPTQKHSAENVIFENRTYSCSSHIPKRCFGRKFGMPVSNPSNLQKCT